MTTTNGIAIEADSSLLGLETPVSTGASLESLYRSTDPIAPARGLVAGILLGSAFWAVALVLVGILAL